MRKIVNLIMILGLTVIPKAYSQPSVCNYYYAGEDMVNINPVDGKVVVYTNGVNLNNPTLGSLTIGKRLQSSAYTAAIYEYDTNEYGLEECIANLWDNGIFAQPIYRDDSGIELIPTNYIYLETHIPFPQNEKAATYGLDYVESLNINHGGYWHVYKLNDNTTESVVTIANQIKEDGAFVSAEPDFSYDALKNVSWDPVVNEQWNIYNKSGIDVGAVGAWSHGTGVGVKITIIDTGVDTTSYDLKKSVIESYDVSQMGFSEKNGGRIYGQHGTMCASIIAAKYNNGCGIAGIAPDSELISISGKLEDSPLIIWQICKGLKKALDINSQIISCSWIPYESKLFYDVIDLYKDNLKNPNIFVIMPSIESGNIRNKIRGYVKMIGSIDKNGNLSSFSCNNGDVFLVAPGEDIPCIGSDGKIIKASGLSMAVAHVTGAIATLVEKNERAEKYEIYNALARGTKKIGEEPYGQNGECGKRNNFFGYGLLNIFNSLKIFPTSLGEDDTVGL